MKFEYIQFENKIFKLKRKNNKLCQSCKFKFEQTNPFKLVSCMESAVYINEEMQNSMTFCKLVSNFSIEEITEPKEIIKYKTLEKQIIKVITVLGSVDQTEEFINIWRKNG